tara:strand:+ start:2239 stop:2691 length:453 start_codon:yes stop_codon:yes gene_type:complete
MTPVHSRINFNHQKKWYLINDDFYIDVKSFQIQKTNMYFWIKEKTYEKRRLTINCEDFTEKEKFGQKTTNFNPIKLNSQKYQIANHLCFITKTKGYSKPFLNVQKNWVKEIINIHNNRVKEIIKIEVPKVINNDNREMNTQSKKEFYLSQ